MNDREARREKFRQEIERRIALFERDPEARRRALNTPLAREIGRRVAEIEAKRRIARQVYDIEARALVRSQCDRLGD
jgi:hypothetical protein